MPVPARVLIVGCGFGGYHAARRLHRLLPQQHAEITVVSPTDHLLYTPLLPEVAGGLLDPRSITVPLTGNLRSRLVLGRVRALDVDRGVATVTDPEGAAFDLGWDRLVLAAGSVPRTLPIPGLAEHAIGFRTTAEAVYLRDHVLQQLELAVTTDDPRLRAARSTFVVIGAGFAGSELVAFLQRLGAAFAHHRTGRYPVEPRWVLIDAAAQVLPDLGPRLGAAALRVLRRRGVDVRLSTTIERVSADSVRTGDGALIDTRTVIWCAGVVPNPVVHTLGVPLDHGRVPVDERLAIRGVPGAFALGDLAAVADLTRPGQYAALTAQHAMRQGRAVAGNVAASLGVGTARAYRHRDLGLAADLGGRSAVARPLGIPLTGLPARAAARGYHLLALPANRARVAATWSVTAGRPPLLVHLDLPGQPGPTLASGAAALR